MENLISLFQKLPEFGWGTKKEFKGTIKDFALTKKLLSGHGSMEIILLRTEHIEDNDKPLDYMTWLNELANSESYCGHMLRNYDFIRGEFEINEDDTGLNKLAKKFIEHN